MVTQADVARRARVWLITHPEVTRADLNPGDGNADNFTRYWTAGPGLAKWRTHPHPWTRLRNLLRKYVGARADGLASKYFHIVHGYWPGDRFGKNPVGPG